jgi:hypothetical protein
VTTCSFIHSYLSFGPYRHLWADCLDKMWEPRRLTALWAITACYRDSFTFTLPKLIGDTTLKMKETQPTETSVPIYQTTWRYALPPKNVIFKWQSHVREPGIDGRIMVHQLSTLYLHLRHIVHCNEIDNSFHNVRNSLLCMLLYFSPHTLRCIHTKLHLLSINATNVVWLSDVWAANSRVLRILSASFRGVSWREWLSWDGNLMLLLMKYFLLRRENLRSFFL